MCNNSMSSRYRIYYFFFSTLYSIIIIIFLLNYCYFLWCVCAEIFYTHKKLNFGKKNIKLLMLEIWSMDKLCGLITVFFNVVWYEMHFFFRAMFDELRFESVWKNEKNHGCFWIVSKSRILLTFFCSYEFVFVIVELI